MHLQTNTLLRGGTYRIVRFIGSGGFGCTYEAEHVMLKKRVAIKEFFMKDHCNRDATTSQVSISSQGAKELVESFKRKFIKEAQTIAALEHPNIVKIHDVFEENGTAYYAMKYIEGGSLSDYIAQHGPMSEQLALRYIGQIASALEYLHSRQMNHLDVKPGNILLNASNDAILIDFGLSKHYDEEGHATSTTPVGISHGYAPMEQYEQNEIWNFSPATDIYSLGATLFYLLVGVKPPKASEVLNDGLPALPGYISPGTRAAIEAAMQPRRKDRPQSVSEFLGLLQHCGAAMADEETHLDNEGPVVVKVSDKPQSKGPKPQPKSQPKPQPEPQPEPQPKDSEPQSQPESQSKSQSKSQSQPQPQPSLWVRYKGVLVGAAVVVGVVIGMLLFRNPQAVSLPDNPGLDMVETLPDTLTTDNNQQSAASKAEEERKAKEESERKAKADAERKAKEEFELKAREESERKAKEEIERKAQEEAELKAKEEAERKAKEEAERKAKEEEVRRLQAALNIEMVYVAGGTFTMGASDLDSEADRVEKPAHSVTLSSYYIGKYEVTQKQWVAVMGSNPSRWKGDNLPVENVSWNDIQEFIRKLNARTGKRYRLPTEAEWEFAARGGNNSRGYKYSGSDNPDAVAWYEGNSGNRTHAVGTKSPNELGIYDMSGNVWEWCQDWYDPDYYSHSPSSNPKGPSSGTHRVLRGGSWNYYAGYSRVSYRPYNAPGNRLSYYGFRLVLAL